MKEGSKLFLVLGLVLILSFSFVSAGLFSDMWTKFTGEVIAGGSSEGYWTNWYNRDGPGGVGDYELISSFVNNSNYPDMCAKPTGIECLTSTGRDLEEINQGDQVTCNVDVGFYCKNDNVDGDCLDYKVRFYCGEEGEEDPVCGNGIQEVGEQCDTNEWAHGATCEYFGYGEGSLSCKNDCTFGFENCKEKSNSTNCVDSDGGLNYYLKGIVTNSNNTGGWAEDMCSDDGINLKEKYCMEGFDSASTNYVCPNGCFDGACILGNQTFYPCESNQLLGDVNGDGLITSADSLSVLNLEKGIATTNDIQCADVNCDGEVNLDDALLIQNYTIGLIEEFECFKKACSNEEEGCVDSYCDEEGDCVLFEEESVEFDGKDYKLIFVDDSRVILGIGEEMTPALGEGQSYILQDGTNIKIYNIIYSSNESVRSYVSFEILNWKNSECDEEGHCILFEGDTVNYKGVDRLSIEFIGLDEVKLNIEGELTNILGSGESYKITEGEWTLIINVKDIGFASKETDRSWVKFDVLLGNNLTCNSGCYFEGECYTYGYVRGDLFCSDVEKIFIGQFDADSSCSNGFECSSGICANNQCVSSSLWKKFLDFFSGLF